VSTNRSTDAERHVAARVKQAREANGWTLEGLSQRMRDAGCYVAPSALYKVEAANPPRRITVDELVAFSAVLGVPMGVLITDPGAELDEDVAAEARAFRESIGEIRAQEAAIVEERSAMLATARAVVAEIRDLTEDSPIGMRIIADLYAEMSEDERARYGSAFIGVVMPRKRGK
jgi:transcriptional regulator with XRE-family HTH domain